MHFKFRAYEALANHDCLKYKIRTLRCPFNYSRLRQINILKYSQKLRLIVQLMYIRSPDGEQYQATQTYVVVVDTWFAKPIIIRNYYLLNISKVSIKIQLYDNIMRIDLHIFIALQISLHIVLKNKMTTFIYQNCFTVCFYSIKFIKVFYNLSLAFNADRKPY